MVRLYASLNGVEYSDTGLTFTYFRAPKISAHTPHGGPVACVSSAVNADGSAVGYSAGARRFKHLTSLQGRVGQETYKPRPVDGTWGPVDACPLKRNWAAAEEPQVRDVLAAGYGAGYGAGDSISIVFERPTAAGLDEGAHRGGKAFVDGLFAFTSSEDIYPLDDSCVGRRCSDGRPCRRVVDCLLEGMGGVASLGADYSGSWSNPWTFVITVVDAAGASLAIAPPTAGIVTGVDIVTGLDIVTFTQLPPVLNLSRALGLEQRSPLVGRT